MKKFSPITPGRRQMTGIEYSKLLTRKEPEKSLLLSLQRTAGRDHKGRISTRHKGGGEKQLYRMIDFGQEKMNVPGKVIALEYDPYRTAFIALVQYQDNNKRYIIAPQNLKVGDEIICADKTPVAPANRMRLLNIPVGAMVHNIELEPNLGGRMVKTAGSAAKILAQEDKFTHLEMPSSEIRKVSNQCFASIGAVSNSEHIFVVLGKAGRSRHMGIRPTVRGNSMNPNDHPHGGGEGRTPIGLKYPKTPWGKNARGVKTREKKRWTSKFIVQRRQKKRK